MRVHWSTSLLVFASCKASRPKLAQLGTGQACQSAVQREGLEVLNPENWIKV
jgi:hypothetical protein